MFGAIKNAFNSIKDTFVSSKQKDVSTLTKIKSTFSSNYFLTDSEIDTLLEDLELHLLQSDLSLSVWENIRDILVKKIKNDGLSKDKDVDLSIKTYFFEIVASLIPKNTFSLDEDKCFKVLFIGTNGTGKTTNIAKFANFLKSNSKSLVLSASDTFRAASIEQLNGFAQKLDVPIVKGKYGQDPASVAYDSCNFAVSKSIDFVLIDSAGRQDNNELLMRELKKIKQVVKPNLTVLVVESLIGQNAVNQAKKFDDAVGVDFLIFSKVDVDPKGGTLISVSISMNKPILFLGNGQNLDDIIFFDENTIKELFIK